jgi:hypothetical protein
VVQEDDVRVEEEQVAKAQTANGNVRRRQGSDLSQADTGSGAAGRVPTYSGIQRSPSWRLDVKFAARRLVAVALGLATAIPDGALLSHLSL